MLNCVSEIKRTTYCCCVCHCPSPRLPPPTSRFAVRNEKKIKDQEKNTTNSNSNLISNSTSWHCPWECCQSWAERRYDLTLWFQHFPNRLQKVNDVLFRILMVQMYIILSFALCIASHKKKKHLQDFFFFHYTCSVLLKDTMSSSDSNVAGSLQPWARKGFYKAWANFPRTQTRSKIQT